MKEIIFPKSETETETVTADSLKNKPCPIIGFEDGVGRRGFVTRKDYRHGAYILSAVNEVHTGNSYGEAGDTNELLNKLKRFAKCFVFDSEKELFTWLAKQK